MKPPKKKKMPRSPKSEPFGQVRWFGDDETGEYRARIRFDPSATAGTEDGSKVIRGRPRRWVPLPGIPRHDEAAAKAKAAAISQKAKREGWPVDAAESRETVRHWFHRWLDYLHESGGSSGQYRSNYTTWIDPVIGTKAMEDVTDDELRTFVSSLNRAVREQKIRWKTARNIWATITSAFSKYAGPRGDREIGFVVRADDPTRDIAPPKKGVTTEKVHLYPDEFLKLITCPKVRLKRRRAYAVAIYLYLRPGELEALEWIDFDLEHETATIQRSLDRERGHAAKSPKNKRARLPSALEVNIVPLLRAMHKESSGVGRVFGRLAGSESDLAERLRADLRRAGVTRHELLNDSAPGAPPRKWMTMHDLRTTGISWMATRGDSPFEIVARAGHSDIAMTNHYISKASLLKRIYRPEHVFPPLPASLLDEWGEDPPDPSELADEDVEHALPAGPDPARAKLLTAEVVPKAELGAAVRAEPDRAIAPVGQPVGPWAKTDQETPTKLSQPWDLNAPSELAFALVFSMDREMSQARREVTLNG
jgi:integrase